MRRLLARIGRGIRAYAGFISSALIISATYISFRVPLFQPKEDEIPIWLIVFLVLCVVALIASYIQQRASNAQAQIAKEENKRHTELLTQIAKAVGATQAEAAENAADTKRQVLELEVRLADESKPVVIIRMSADGEKNTNALPLVENIGKSAATNIKIEDVLVNGARGAGTFEEIDALAPGEKQEVSFDAPDQGLVFRRSFIGYLENDLEHRPPVNWDDRQPLEGIFTPLRMPLYVTYTDPTTGRRYRATHELEFTFSKHVTVTFKHQSELT